MEEAMKYIALWLAVAAALTLAGLVIFGGAQLVQFIMSDPRWQWVPWIVLAIICIATIAAVIDYLSDHRQPKVDE
jgi:hypothetical protein